MFKLLSSLLFFFAGTTALIKDCDPSSQFKLTELGLYPDPPVKGQNVYMTVIFDNPGPEITDGDFVTSVTFNGIPLSPSHKALCSDTTCPLTVGINNRSTMSVWPDTVSGKINSKIQWFDTNGKSLLCIQSSVAVASDIYEPVPKNKSLVERSLWTDKHHDAPPRPNPPPEPHHNAPAPPPPSPHHDNPVPPPAPHHSDAPKPPVTPKHSDSPVVPPHHSDKPKPAPKHSDKPKPAPKHSDKPKPAPKPPVTPPHHSDHPEPAPHHSDKPTHHKKHSDKPKHHKKHSDSPVTPPVPVPQTTGSNSGMTGSMTTGSGSGGIGTTTGTTSGSTSGTTSGSMTTGSSSGGTGTTSGTTSGTTGTPINNQPGITIYIKNIFKGLLQGSSDDDSSASQKQSSNTGSSQQSDNQVPQTYSLRKHRNTHRK